MKYIFPLLALLFILTGCDKAKVSELERKNADLQRQYDNVTHDLSLQSQYVDEVTKAINSVYGNMQRINEGEMMLSKSEKELEMGKGATQAQLRDRIVNQIAGIDTFLIQNRKKLNDLEKKLKNSRVKYDGLKKMVENLKTQLAEKEHSIAVLEEKLKEKNVQIQSLEERLTQKADTVYLKEQTIATQQKEIRKAYYTIGTLDEMQSKGIVNREGGFLGLFGKTNVLASGFDRSDFITIDRLDQTTIEIAGKVAELIPKRKENYYTITTEASSTKLLVLDPEKFWQDSYLVIIVK